jgi:hypothetical protein
MLKLSVVFEKNHVGWPILKTVELNLSPSSLRDGPPARGLRAEPCSGLLYLLFIIIYSRPDSSITQSIPGF